MNYKIKKLKQVNMIKILYIYLYIYGRKRAKEYSLYNIMANKKTTKERKPLFFYVFFYNSNPKKQKINY